MNLAINIGMDFFLEKGLLKPLLVGCGVCWTMSASADVGRMKISDDFEVEHIYDVSAQNQGSWVALCVDGKGRLIAGDQEGDLFRVALDNGEVNSVEPIELDIGYVNGLEYAFDSLYAVVAEDKYQGGGLYRIRDLDGDDE